MNPTIGNTKKSIETLLTGQESIRKQINVDSDLHNTINNLADKLNNRISNGVLIYEAMMMQNDEYTDQISNYESRVDTDLSEYYTTTQIQQINEYNVHTKGQALTYMRNQIPAGVDRDQKIKRYQIRLPSDLVDQTDFMRGWNGEIKNAMIHYLRSAFNSRIDRIQTKEQIVKYKNDEINKLQDQTQEIVDQIDSADIKIASINEYKQYNPSNRSKRKELISNLVKNNNINKEHVKKIFENTHNINGKQYRNEEINKIWEEHNLIYHAYNSSNTIEDKHDLQNLNKNLITKATDDIKDLRDALIVIDALLDAHETLKIPFIAKYIEPQINQKIEFSKHPDIEADGSIIRRID